jgi:Fe-S cluster assembly ATP-binding protein
MLAIHNLHASAGTTPILKGVTLQINPGEVHAIMGPNGSGKSTLAHALAGHPDVTVEQGTAQLNGTDLLALDPAARAAAGLFLAFQYPASLPGVKVSQFLRLTRQAQERARGEEVSGSAAILRELRTAMQLLSMPLAMAERSVNDGFSGGEKKRLELLQMLLLKPSVIMLDEIDSGLDIDALKVTAEAVATVQQSRPATAFLIITHYQRLLDHIAPHVVHVMKDGVIVQSGDASLAHSLEKTGYANLS